MPEPFAVDQYYANHPEELFDAKLDELLVEIDSKVVLEGGVDMNSPAGLHPDAITAHLQCAGFEMPISTSDEQWFGPSMKDICEQSLVKDKDGW